MMPDFKSWLKDYPPAEMGSSGIEALLEEAYKCGARDGCEFYMPAQQTLLLTPASIDEKLWQAEGQEWLERQREVAAGLLGVQLQPYWREVEKIRRCADGSISSREYIWSIKVSTP